MAGKHPVMPDLSTVYYGAPMHYDYYKNTFTHNTVCINAQNQPPCDGRTVRFERRGEETLVEGHADWLSPLAELDSFTICQWDEAAYRGVVMRRTILFTDAFFLEAFRVRGAARAHGRLDRASGGRVQRRARGPIRQSYWVIAPRRAISSRRTGGARKGLSSLGGARRLARSHCIPLAPRPPL